MSLRGVAGAGPAGELFALGTHAVHLDPFLRIPTFHSPAPQAIWNRETFNWSVDGGALSSFDSYRIYGASGALAWSIMSPGHLPEFKLPDLNAMEGLPIFPNGQKRSILYRVKRPDFDIDRHDSRVFRLMEWRAWVLMSWTFDDPTQNIPVGTVPGT